MRVLFFQRIYFFKLFCVSCVQRATKTHYSLFRFIGLPQRLLLIFKQSLTILCVYTKVKLPSVNKAIHKKLRLAAIDRNGKTVAQFLNDLENALKSGKTCFFFLGPWKSSNLPRYKREYLVYMTYTAVKRLYFYNLVS